MQPRLSSKSQVLICILRSGALLIMRVPALQPMGYKLHCETDPEKALKWVNESVVLPDIGELAASSAYWEHIPFEFPTWSLCQRHAASAMQHGRHWCMANPTTLLTDNVGLAVCSAARLHDGESHGSA